MKSQLRMQPTSAARFIWDVCKAVWRRLTGKKLRIDPEIEILANLAVPPTQESVYAFIDVQRHYLETCESDPYDRARGAVQ
jgi:hypothetical protein